MRAHTAWVPALCLALSCADESPEVQRPTVGEESPSNPDGSGDGTSVPPATKLTFAADVQPVKSVEEAQARVFVPPYWECKEPLDGKAGKGPDGKVCTNVAISGSTEPGRRFADYASCDVVITQRPFWSAPPAGKTPPNDPRLQDSAYMSELAWITEQVEATGCVCCHDSKVLGKQAGQWDIRLGPIWLDSLSDPGLALFAGLADSTSLGAYAPGENNGFDRNVVGLPTTDNERMKRFMLSELARRGISEEEARAVPPFGGPIYSQRFEPPRACAAGEGVDEQGTVRWKGAGARYVYVLRDAKENPGVPPNLDTPQGTLFRLDVLASKAPVESGFRYGTTPPGSFQRVPEASAAPALERGVTYQLTVFKDVGLPIVNCEFTFGEKPAATRDAGSTAIDAGAPTPSNDASMSGSTDAAGGSCTLAGGDAQGFGAACTASSECTCAANYCALMPGQTQGYCTKTECVANEALCPDGWSCFDISRFAPGQPSICTR